MEDSVGEDATKVLRAVATEVVDLDLEVHGTEGPARGNEAILRRI